MSRRHRRHACVGVARPRIRTRARRPSAGRAPTAAVSAAPSAGAVPRSTARHRCRPSPSRRESARATRHRAPRVPPRAIPRPPRRTASCRIDPASPDAGCDAPGVDRTRSHRRRRRSVGNRVRVQLPSTACSHAARDQSWPGLRLRAQPSGVQRARSDSYQPSSHAPLAIAARLRRTRSMSTCRLWSVASRSERISSCWNRCRM